MQFSNRACRTCKQRRVKCDETFPSCKRCEKAKLKCDGVGKSGALLFVDENEFAVGQRKRPRGPNTRPAGNETSVTLVQRKGTPNKSGISTGPFTFERHELSVMPALQLPIQDQAICYYSTHHVTLPSGLPELADGHLMYALNGWSNTTPRSILDLAVSAISYATFGRARADPSTIAAGRANYSRALIKTNAALRDPEGLIKDDVLIAVMLLSFFENAIYDSSAHDPSQDLRVMASQSFAHHNGAMEILRLRHKSRVRNGIAVGPELDKLVRRQLLRSLLLRGMPVPGWMARGAEFGEDAVAVDRVMVGVINLRHDAGLLFGSTGSVMFLDDDIDSRLLGVLDEAQTLEQELEGIRKTVQRKAPYTTHIVEHSSAVYDGKVDVYKNVGYAAVWERHRTLHLVVLDVILKILPWLNDDEGTYSETLSKAAASIDRLSTDLCTTVPYLLGLVQLHHTDDGGHSAVVSTSASARTAARATTAAFLCWPLTMATMMTNIPRMQAAYLRERLFDTSVIVDDGLLARIALGHAEA